MTNNPRKINALKDLGINVVDREPIQADSNPHNVQYLSTKAAAVPGAVGERGVSLR